MSDFVRIEKHGLVSLLIIDRPAVRNALSSMVIEQLGGIIKDVHNDHTLRALVITGAGDKTFSAGADLKERQGMDEVETIAFVKNIQKTFQEIADLPMPTIAAINGDAFGGGLELALASDLRVMNRHSMIGLTECSLGIIPGAGGTQRLPRLIGVSRALDLIFRGRRINGEEALSMGLVNYLADDADDARAYALKIALEIGKNAPLAIRAAKKALQCAEERMLKEGLALELVSYREIVKTADRREGLKAFLEKRAPEFRGE